MNFHPDKHHRRSIRLKGYDYSQAGAYYITICAQNRDCMFGEIINGEMKLNAAGKMLHNWWNQLPHKYPNIELDEFIVMSNHLHGMIIVGADPRVCPDIDTENGNIVFDMGEHTGSPLQKSVKLSQMIQWFKTMTINEYIRNVKQNDWHPFNKRLWQRNYYEHIIRDENELNRIRKYIIENQPKWDLDDNNPNNIGTN